MCVRLYLTELGKMHTASGHPSFGYLSTYGSEFDSRSPGLVTAPFPAERSSRSTFRNDRSYVICEIDKLQWRDPRDDKWPPDAFNG